MHDLQAHTQAPRGRGGTSDRQKEVRDIRADVRKPEAEKDYGANLLEGALSTELTANFRAAER